MITAAKIRRLQTIRRPSFNPELRKIDSESPSTSSSTTSVASNPNVEPVASTSALKPEQDITKLHQHHEIELRPLVKAEARDVGGSGIPQVILDPFAGTHVERLDPTRDGFYARLRNNAAYFGMGVVITGIGGLAAGTLTGKTLFSPNNTNVGTIANTNTSEIQSNQTQTDYTFLRNAFDDN